MNTDAERGPLGVWLVRQKEQRGFTNRYQAAADITRLSGTRVPPYAYATYEARGDLLLRDTPKIKQHREAIEKAWGSLPLEGVGAATPIDRGEMPPPWAIDLTRVLADAIGTAIGEALASNRQPEGSASSDRPEGSAIPRPGREPGRARDGGTSRTGR